MSLSELQDWLLTDGVQADLATLARHMAASEIDNLAHDPEAVALTTIDWQRLVFAGSILARSEVRSHLEAALRIATGAVTVSSSQPIKDAGAVLLGKLSNRQAINLASSRELLTPDLDSRLGISLRLEAQHRQLDQTVLVESSGRWLSVNTFQQRFWEEAARNQWLSASAPTASGKTYLVLQWLLDQMLTHDLHVAIYLAPTRALVAEIEANLKQIVAPGSNIEVSSLPLRDKFDTTKSESKRLVLVFTQERLHLMANLMGDAVKLDLLIVDEAHKVGDDQRGVILQDAIERVCRLSPSVKVVFISPATQNPEELLTDAPEGAATVSVTSDTPTVLQNVVVAEQVPRKPKEWALTAVQTSRSLNLGVLHLASSPLGVRKRLAFIAAAVGERGGGTLVYANTADESEKVADLIGQLLPQSDVTDPEVTALADLARKAVHPNYQLAPLVEKGVAFHYGNMPSLIRQEIERLFRSGKIRFLVCTSTLIEGVNLSCRTIVVRGPRKGKGHPMEPHDFWNLAGRAGRWGNEFQGNIICIEPSDRKAWPSGVPARARYPIRRESDAVLDLGDAMAAYLDRRAADGEDALQESEKFEQVGSYLLANYMRLGSVAQASFAKRHSPERIARLEESLSRIAATIEVSSDLSARHPGVSALGLQRLLVAFRSYEGDPENLLPAPIASRDAYDRFITIMRRINQHVFPAFMPDGLVPLHALIVSQWLQGYSLATMIQRNIRWHRENGRPFRLPVLIRNTMELVEHTARFLAPKYLSAYVDVLNLHLGQIGRADLVDETLDIGTQLEFGISSQTLLSLVELGLSRLTAVTLYAEIARDDLSKEACIEWVRDRNTHLEGMNIPSIIIREIREKILTTDA
ncbi:DEAD/DEAH box helicase [Bradyrhizobium sp.]|uniref:DEAD/DEAH box helicase n=1 Tax=Bradyrhizobium sp. TaxID=376 RepID=UPI0039E62E89